MKEMLQEFSQRRQGEELLQPRKQAFPPPEEQRVIGCRSKLPPRSRQIQEVLVSLRNPQTKRNRHPNQSPSEPDEEL